MLEYGDDDDDADSYNSVACYQIRRTLNST